MKFQNILGIILSVTCLVLVNSANANILLADDFDGTSLSPVWSLEQGFADAGGGYVDVHGSTPGSRDGWIAAGEGSLWSNYHLSTHFIADGGGDNWYHGDIAFRVQDFHPWTSGTFYRVMVDTPIWGGGPGVNGGGTLTLARIANDNFSVLDTASPFPGVVANRDNLIDIWAIGNHIQIAVNGTHLIDLSDPTPILTGGIALGAIWESHVRYDYAFVGSTTAVPEPQQWLMLLLAGVGLVIYQLHGNGPTSGPRSKP